MDRTTGFTNKTNAKILRHLEEMDATILEGLTSRHISSRQIEHTA